MSTSAMGISPNTIQHPLQFAVDGVELLPDGDVARPPSSAKPMREGSRDGMSGCLMCGGPRPRHVPGTARAPASSAVIDSAINPPRPI